ncbi:Hypothetical protein CAP_9024 [Chondromyces apiculatus DSM 436]|uniref:Uncharacterized protein n=1 Tax=Chondromyces apiculatus DSM 436 TaxID=1192034 RepID=A0A017SW14_9BACT|nr:Hypothetical protein CAP_9024 [Chondromyces apiculatus DSM 436]
MHLEPAEEPRPPLGWLGGAGRGSAWRALRRGGSAWRRPLFPSWCTDLRYAPPGTEDPVPPR